jgi:hypothetical protein
LNTSCANQEKKTPPLAALAGPVANELSGAIMPSENNLWQQANKQAKQVGKLKNKKAKSRQVVLLCETLKQALKGGK